VLLYHTSCTQKSYRCRSTIIYCCIPNVLHSQQTSFSVQSHLISSPVARLQANRSHAIVHHLAYSKDPYHLMPYHSRKHFDSSIAQHSTVEHCKALHNTALHSPTDCGCISHGHFVPGFESQVRLPRAHLSVSCPAVPFEGAWGRCTGASSACGRHTWGRSSQTAPSHRPTVDCKLNPSGRGRLRAKRRAPQPTNTARGKIKVLMHCTPVQQRAEPQRRAHGKVVVAEPTRKCRSQHSNTAKILRTALLPKRRPLLPSRCGQQCSSRHT